MEEIKFNCPYCKGELTLEVEEITNEEAEIKVTLDKNDECNLFRAVISSYGVGASYGDRQTMTINKPFVDTDNCFRNGVIEYQQADIAPYWKDVVFGRFVFDENNPRVARLINEGVLERPYSY